MRWLWNRSKNIKLDNIAIKPVPIDINSNNIEYNFLIDKYSKQHNDVLLKWGLSTFNDSIFKDNEEIEMNFTISTCTSMGRVIKCHWAKEFMYCNVLRELNTIGGSD